MWRRRDMLAALVGGGAALLNRPPRSQAQPPRPLAPPAPPVAPRGARSGRGRVITPNGSTMPWRMRGGVKEFHIRAQAFDQEVAPGMTMKVWGYNGSTPGPTIEAYEGDRVRLFVTNELPEHTTIHWHGLFLPNGMDGVGGLTQPHIKPGETYAYEFTLKQHGTFMYHPHADEMVQMAVGMMGMFIIHPRRREAIDRDFAILLHEWAVHPGTYRPDPAVMLDFNLFTFNGRAYPGTEPLVVKTGDRVRIRLGNLSMNQHPIHLHGFSFDVTATDGGTIPRSARWPQTTAPVPVGSTRDIEFVADVPGDWAFHCHKSHHTMNAMGHDLPNMLGVSQAGVEQDIAQLLPGYMAMGETGMAEMQPMAEHATGPENTLPMMAGKGPFGPIEMGGMFTLLKVRDDPAATGDRYYDHPPGTVAQKVPRPDF